MLPKNSSINYFFSRDNGILLRHFEEKIGNRSPSETLVNSG